MVDKKNYVERSSRSGGDPMSGPGGNQALWDVEESNVTGNSVNGDVGTKGRDERRQADAARSAVHAQLYKTGK